MYVGDEDTECKNWEGVVEKVGGKLEKWRWLLPQMSYRGRVLIINNLATSVLWHRLACIEPPPGVIHDLQVLLVYFFWDNQHWVLQAVLFFCPRGRWTRIGSPREQNFVSFCDLRSSPKFHIFFQLNIEHLKSALLCV